MSTISEILFAFILVSQHSLAVGMKWCWSRSTSIDSNTNISSGISHNPLITPVTNQITRKIGQHRTEQPLNVDVITYLSEHIAVPIVTSKREEYFSMLFKSRKEMIMDSINNNQTYSILKSRPVNANSFLLMLTSKDSIYFNVASNPETHRVLHDGELIFFRSINYENTTIVIRRCFMAFINYLVSISGQPLTAMLYLNEIQHTDDTEMDELISIMTFVELHYNNNHLHSHQEARANNKKFIIDFVYLSPSNKPKTLKELNEYIPIPLYEKLIIIDALGYNGWNFGNLADKTRRRENYNGRVFAYLQHQIVPIQMSKIEGVATKAIINDTFYPTLCSDIRFYCKALPKDIGFVDRWIGSAAASSRGNKNISPKKQSRLLVAQRRVSMDGSLRIESIGNWEGHGLPLINIQAPSTKSS